MDWMGLDWIDVHGYGCGCRYGYGYSFIQHDDLDHDHNHGHGNGKGVSWQDHSRLVSVYSSSLSAVVLSESSRHVSQLFSPPSLLSLLLSPLPPPLPLLPALSVIPCLASPLPLLLASILVPLGSFAFFFLFPSTTKESPSMHDSSVQGISDASSSLSFPLPRRNVTQSLRLHYRYLSHDPYSVPSCRRSGCVATAWFAEKTRRRLNSPHETRITPAFKRQHKWNLTFTTE